MAPWEEIAFTLADRGDWLGTASKASVDYGLNSVLGAEVAVWEFFAFTVTIM